MPDVQNNEAQWEQSWADWGEGKSSANDNPIEAFEAPAVEEAQEEPAAVPEELDQVTIMKTVLDELRALKEQVNAKDSELAVMKQKLDEAAIVKAATANVPPPMDTWVRIGTDKPAGLEEKLSVMERQAVENGEPFDKERTRRVFLGLPVEDLNKHVFMGHAFDTEEEMEVYKSKVLDEQQRVVGKYPR